jgi:hypothetical protein
MSKMPHAQYVNVTQQDVKDLLSLLENKESGILESRSVPVQKESSKNKPDFLKVSDAILSALDKQDAGLFMQAIGLLNSSISKSKNIQWGSVFNVLSTPEGYKKFLYMFRSQQEALGHWKNSMLTSMQNKDLAFSDKLSFVKVLSLFDKDTSLRAASSIPLSHEREKPQIEGLISKIQKGEALEF